MGKKTKWIPRWLYQPVTIDATSELNAPSTFFQNLEVWDWHLCFLSFVGTAALDGAGDYTNVLGGVGRRLRFNVGISQLGDVNIVYSSGQAMFGPDRPYLVHSNDLNSGALFTFDPGRPVIMPPDIGLLAEVQNQGDENIDNLGLLVTATEEVNGYTNPVHFASHAPAELAPGDDYTLDHPDLFNNGENDAVLRDMILNGFLKNEDNTQVDTFDDVWWRVNPSGGVQWMPDPSLIPVGCIAPFNRALFDPSDVGPRAYGFTEYTKLKPRQRLSVEIQNHSASEQTVHLCLFGYLEVPS